VLSLESKELHDLPSALGREWLLPDGLGGWSASTAVGTHTRRAHGLLVVATRQPLGRLLLLSRIEETLEIGGESIGLSSNLYTGVVHPRGFEHASHYSLLPFPSLTFRGPSWELTRTVIRPRGEPGIIVHYALDSRGPARLQLRPLLAYREPGHLQHENDHVCMEVGKDGVYDVTEPFVGCPRLFTHCEGAAFQPDPHWYRGFVFPGDVALPSESEDLFSPGTYVVDLAPEGRTSLSAWAAHPPQHLPNGAALIEHERERLRRATYAVASTTGLLRRAADIFVARASETTWVVLPSVPSTGISIAESLRCLPGLCLALGRYREARAILTQAARHVEGGRLRDEVAEWDQHHPSALSTLAALWFVQIAHAVAETAADVGFIRSRIRDAAFGILDVLSMGREASLRPDGDGLLTEPDGRRTIETQALWYNALLSGAALATQLGETQREVVWTALAAKVRNGVHGLFWLPEEGYLAPSIVGGEPDRTLDVSQLLAIGLRHGLLPGDRATLVIEAVERDLLTPVGLRRTPDSPDAAPSLVGVYGDAIVRIRGEEGKQLLRDWLADFAPRIAEGVPGAPAAAYSVREPHRPRSPLVHAFTVAELLRTALRVAGKPPSTKDTPKPPTLPVHLTSA
jgi:predicted glycogen debranching enzyme